MNDDLPPHHRLSIRLCGYDYAQSGAYFVTLCTYQRVCIFGDVVEGEMRVSPIGAVVRACWDAIPSHFPVVDLDAFVVMPNHMHGIIVIAQDVQINTDTIDKTNNAGVTNVGATHGSPHMHQL